MRVGRAPRRQEALHECARELHSLAGRELFGGNEAGAGQRRLRFAAQDAADARGDILYVGCPLAHISVVHGGKHGRALLPRLPDGLGGLRAAAIAAVMRSAKSSSSAISWWTEKISASASPSSALAFS